jgi:protein involved in polysaccharide export with SLBB domain
MLQDEITDKLKAFITAPKVKVTIKQGKELAEEVKPEEELKLEEVKVEKKEYLISPGDILSIIVKDHGEYNLNVVVQNDGKISYPPLGEIQAVGFTENQTAQNIVSGLIGYIDNPQVTTLVKGHADFTEVEPDQMPDYIIKPGDVVYINIDKHVNYNHVMVVQINGSIYYPPIGEIQVVGKSISTFIDIFKSKLPFKVNPQQLRVSIRKFKNITEETERVEAKFPMALTRFGYDFFAGARNRILKPEKVITAEKYNTQKNNTQNYDTQNYGNENYGTEKRETTTIQKDAISGFVGPTDMIDTNVNATIPDRYILGPGDRITITYWTDVIELRTESLVVDENGEVTIEKLGKMVVRGMTLAQFQDAVKTGLSRVAYKNLQLFATLDRLRSIQIFITGETFKPGSYAVSAVTTLFNALYLCGGPNENGSLRDIRIIKRNETKVVDFYKFLMKGDSSQDYSLDSGDTIMIPLIGRTVTITGEVKKPAVYELKEGENLKELITIAGGIRPTGFLQRVRVDSVDSGKKRAVIDVDLSDPNKPDVPILDGDNVTVFSIPSERMNIVTVEGKVNMPGTYQLKDGMRVSDLLNMSQGLLGEAFMERADLIRLNSDRKTTTLVPLNLSKALSGEPESNVALNQWDKLIIYSKWDVKWNADRMVDIHGAIQHPGSYERPDGMKIYDLLIKAGGTLPNAYTNRAYLFRLDETGNMTKSIPINIKLAMQKDADNNVALQDDDTLMIYTYQEARWEPKRQVNISGAVQNQGFFTRTDSMKISDLIQIAGGILPNAFPDRILLLRLDERQKSTQGFFINLKLALQDDPKNNLELKDGDEIQVYTYEQAKWEPENIVMVLGAVQNPNIFKKTDGMKVSSLLHRSGGVLPNAYLDRADIERFLPDKETYMIISVNLAKVLSGDESADMLLEAGDSLKVYTLEEVQYKPDNIVTIYGAIQNPNKYTRAVNMKLSDLLFISGGLIPGANKSIEISRINDDGKSINILVDVTLLTKGDNNSDPVLKDGDVVFVRKDKDFLDKLRVITLSGEVKYPGSYTLRSDERLSELIKRAGGLTERAYPEASTVTRKIEYLVLDEQMKSIRQVSHLLDDLADQEFSREYARALLEQGGKNPAGSASTAAQVTSSLMGLVGGTSTGTEAISSIPQQIQSIGQSVGEAKQYQYTMVTPARKIYSLLPPGRLLVNINKALTNSGTKDDIVLKDGDVIMIPTMPASVSVTGAVVQPSSILYIQGKSLNEYLEMTGGYSSDADEKAVYVVKANGMVIKGNKAKIAPGDLIVVPTKVMVQKVTDRWGQIIGMLKFAVGTIATLYTVKLIIGRI